MAVATTAKEKGAGALYLARQNEPKDEVVVDVTVPSGFVFKFKQPSAYSLLFKLGNLPSSATEHAVEAWKRQGLIPEDSDGTGEEVDQVKMGLKALQIRDQVLRLSRVPKLVVGTAADESELSTDDLADEDSEYLFKWVAAGGDAGAMLAMFPGGAAKSSLASASRKKRGRSAE